MNLIYLFSISLLTELTSILLKHPKNQMLALAVCVGVSMGTMYSAEAAPARNVNPPALKASAPNVYVVKKAIHCGIFQNVS